MFFIHMTDMCVGISLQLLQSQMCFMQVCRVLEIAFFVVVVVPSARSVDKKTCFSPDLDPLL